MSRFADRTAAGRALVAPLRALGLERPLLVGLVRGGVPVAVAVAEGLDAAGLDVQVDVAAARKVTRPGSPEAGLGAVAAGGDPVWFRVALAHQGLTPHDLDDEVAAARAEVRRREEAFGAGRVEVAGRDVVLCDDGVATGVTAQAALVALSGRDPRRLVLATPVLAGGTRARLADEWGGEVVALRVPEDFGAVADAYDDFAQLSDDDARRALRAWGPPPR